MKTKTIGGHSEYFVRGSHLASAMATIISIVKFILVIATVALMFFK